jgi:hypothetical protein
MSVQRVRKGQTFSTQTPDGRLLESGCLALEDSDDNGDFAAIDSEGVICTFNRVMVASCSEGTV